MMQVEVNNSGARRGDGVAFTPFVPESLGYFVTWPPIPLLIFRLAHRRCGAQALLLQATLAILIDQNTPLPASTFSPHVTETEQPRRFNPTH
ncbi:hypothetical protein, partial [Salmonella enterica]|uniref:hypothetical protein n=1 Tax=Salmonella enterica TaxID=28901 RepID=UPI00398C7D55